jgi:DNA sulfur modification protein DndD
MNGHGKTSLLTALYLGLYGPDGLRFVEGLDSRQDSKTERSVGYRNAIKNFRHRHSPMTEPAVVDITLNREGEIESHESLRICRKWYFQSNGELRQNDSGEEVQLYLDDTLVDARSLEDVRHNVQEHIFPPDLAPAFLFDGEQAQRMIFDGGSQSFQREVAVLFGTSRVDEAAKSARNYSSRITQSVGGRQKSDEREKRLSVLKQEREGIDSDLQTLKEQLDEHERERGDVLSKVQEIQDELQRSGDNGQTVSDLHIKLTKASEKRERADSRLTELAEQLSLSMAAVRLSEPVNKRLAMEAKRETWESAKNKPRNAPGVFSIMQRPIHKKKTHCCGTWPPPIGGNCGSELSKGSG